MVLSRKERLALRIARQARVTPVNGSVAMAAAAWYAATSRRVILGRRFAAGERD
jgi:hypothetical protein